MTLIGARYTKWSINLIELTPVDDFQLEIKPKPKKELKKQRIVRQSSARK